MRRPAWHVRVRDLRTANAAVPRARPARHQAALLQRAWPGPAPRVRLRDQGAAACDRLRPRSSTCRRSPTDRARSCRSATRTSSRGCARSAAGHTMTVPRERRVFACLRPGALRHRDCGDAQTDLPLPTKRAGARSRMRSRTPSGAISTPTSTWSHAVRRHRLERCWRCSRTAGPQAARRSPSADSTRNPDLLTSRGRGAPRSVPTTSRTCPSSTSTSRRSRAFVDSQEHPSSSVRACRSFLCSRADRRHAQGVPQRRGRRRAVRWVRRVPAPRRQACRDATAAGRCSSG